jgi:hypothetical protein
VLAGALAPIERVVDRRNKTPADGRAATNTGRTQRLRACIDSPYNDAPAAISLRRGCFEASR